MTPSSSVERDATAAAAANGRRHHQPPPQQRQVGVGGKPRARTEFDRAGAEDQHRHVSGRTSSATGPPRRGRPGSRAPIAPKSDRIGVPSARPDTRDAGSPILEPVLQSATSARAPRPAARDVSNAPVSYPDTIAGSGQGRALSARACRPLDRAQTSGGDRKGRQQRRDPEHAWPIVARAASAPGRREREERPPRSHRTATGPRVPNGSGTRASGRATAPRRAGEAPRLARVVPPGAASAISRARARAGPGRPSGRASGDREPPPVQVATTDRRAARRRRVSSAVTGLSRIQTASAEIRAGEPDPAALACESYRGAATRAPRRERGVEPLALVAGRPMASSRARPGSPAP